MNEDVVGGDNPFLSPEEQRDRYLHRKRNTGSLYRPTLFPLHETRAHPPQGDSSTHFDLSGAETSSAWPLPPDFDPRQGLASWTASSEQNSPHSSRNHRVGQVSAYRTADQLHSTPMRNNSGRRKPVPNHSEDLDVPGDRSIAGHLSFISTSTSPTPAVEGSSSIPSPASFRYMYRSAEATPGSSSRQQKRRDTDPANAVIPRSPNDSSMYSDSTDYQDDRALFFRPPVQSPSSSSPGRSTTVSPHVSVVPPSRTSMSAGWHKDRPEMAMALSSLARVRRDTGVNISNTLEPPSAVSSNGGGGADRSSTTTWSSDDLTPKASERGWWSGDKVDT